MTAFAKASVLLAFLFAMDSPPSCSAQTTHSAGPIIVAEYSVPDSSDFVSMTTGPDGALWFTDIAANAIGRIDGAAMTMRRYALPRPTTNPMGISVGPDGALWFAEEGYSTIGRISTNGEVKEYTTPLGRIDPYTLAVGSDGALWFSASAEGLGRITTDGRVSLQTLPATYNDVRAMITGPDRALWFIDDQRGGYSRFSQTGSVTDFRLPSGYPHSIVTCPDGHMWMPSYGPLGTRETYRIFRASTDGRAVEYRLQNPDPLQEATLPTPLPTRLQSISIRACPVGRCGPTPPQPMSFGIAGCFPDAVWFWIGPDHVGRIDLASNAVVGYDLDVGHPTSVRPLGGRLIWFQDERSGKLYEIAVP